MMAFGLTFMACYSPVGACVTLSMKTTVAIIALYQIVYGAGRDTCAGGASYTATRGRHGAAVQCSHGRRRGVRPAIRHTTSHKDSIMAQLEKVLYTGKTHTTGGRDGKSRSSGGRLVGLLHRRDEPGGQQDESGAAGRRGGGRRSGPVDDRRRLFFASAARHQPAGPAAQIGRA